MLDVGFPTGHHPGPPPLHYITLLFVDLENEGGTAFGSPHVVLHLQGVHCVHSAVEKRGESLGGSHQTWSLREINKK